VGEDLTYVVDKVASPQHVWAYGGLL